MQHICYRHFRTSHCYYSLTFSASVIFEFFFPRYFITVRTLFFNFINKKVSLATFTFPAFPFAFVPCFPPSIHTGISFPARANLIFHQEWRQTAIWCWVFFFSYFSVQKDNSAERPWHKCNRKAQTVFSTAFILFCLPRVIIFNTSGNLLPQMQIYFFNLRIISLLQGEGTSANIVFLVMILLYKNFS